MIILITSVLYQFVIISLIEYFFREEEITITDYEKFEKIETYKRLMNKVTDRKSTRLNSSHT